jgi:hypothetical protein
MFEERFGVLDICLWLLLDIFTFKERKRRKNVKAVALTWYLSKTVHSLTAPLPNHDVLRKPVHCIVPQ